MSEQGVLHFSTPVRGLRRGNGPLRNIHLILTRQWRIYRLTETPT